MFLCEGLVLRELYDQLLLCVIMSLLLVLRYIVIWRNHKSPVSISSIFHDLTERILWNPMTLTAFVFTELANTMKYGGGLLYNLVFTEWRHCVLQNCHISRRLLSPNFLFGRYGRSHHLCYQTKWGLMDDFRDAKSAEFLYEVENVFVPCQLRICGIN